MSINKTPSQPIIVIHSVIRQTRSAYGPGLTSGVRISGQQGVRISGQQGVRISAQHGVRISNHQGVRISAQQGVRISGAARQACARAAA